MGREKPNSVSEHGKLSMHFKIEVEFLALNFSPNWGIIYWLTIVHIEVFPPSSGMNVVAGVTKMYKVMVTVIVTL